MSMQKSTLIGYLGKDPELKYTQNGTACLEFSVAHGIKKGDQETTQWWRCTAWGAYAESLTKLVESGSLCKGREVYIEGPSSASAWTKDGNTNVQLEQTVYNLQLLGKKPTDTNGE